QPAPISIFTLSLHDALPICDLKEAPLRRDVRSLGRLLGEVLKEQVGIEFFTAVEELRLLLIEHREARARREASDKKAVDEDQLKIGRHTSELQSRGHLVCRL